MRAICLFCVLAAWQAIAAENVAELIKAQVEIPGVPQGAK